MNGKNLATLAAAFGFAVLTACSSNHETAKVNEKTAAPPAASQPADHTADHAGMGHGAMNAATDHAAHSAPAGPAAAMATLKGGPNNPNLSGTITFTPDGDRVHVVADLKGVDKAGMHGFHIHDKGECTGDFSSAGGHFNPTGAPHACAPTDPLHAGDFGNITVADDGTAHLDVYTTHIALSGSTSVIGKAVVLHAGEDDCKTQPSGNSGARAACGVIHASSSGM